MSSLLDENTDGATADGDGAGDTSSAEAERDDTSAAGLRAAIKAEREKRQAAQAEFDRLKAERAEAEGLYNTEKTRADGLAEKVAAYEQRETERLAAVDARNTERIDKLPEAIKGLVPEGLTGDALAGWLDKAGSVSTETLPAGTRTRGGGEEAPPPECVAQAQQLGEDPKQWFQLFKDAAVKPWAAS